MHKGDTMAQKRVTLYNVIDSRNGQFHSVVICRERDAKYFVSADGEEE